MIPPLLPSAVRSPPDVLLVERLSDCDWKEIQSISGWRRRFGVGAGAVGVVADTSLRAGWLSVDWGVGGLCPNGLGLRSRWVLEGKRKRLRYSIRYSNSNRMIYCGTLTCWSLGSLHSWPGRAWRSWPFWTELVQRGRGGSWVRWSQKWSLSHQPFPYTVPHLKQRKQWIHVHSYSPTCCSVQRYEVSPLLRRNWLWTAVLRGVLLTSVPLIGHEGFVDSKVFDIRFQDVHNICLTGNHHKLREKNMLSITDKKILWPENSVLYLLHVPSSSCWCKSSHLPASSSEYQGC